MPTHASPSQSAEDYLERIHELPRRRGHHGGSLELAVTQPRARDRLVALRSIPQRKRERQAAEHDRVALVELVAQPHAEIRPAVRSGERAFRPGDARSGLDSTDVGAGPHASPKRVEGERSWLQVARERDRVVRMRSDQRPESSHGIGAL